MKSFFLILFSLFLLPILAESASNDSSDAVSSPTPPITNHALDTGKALIVHKPKPSPSWGKVIQYRRTENFVQADNARETLYEFLFQDEAGIVRTATYHENASGDGYWEVWVWDQP